jgi:ubiquitin-protein ligase
MIEFNCPNCGKRFRVPPELAGRSAKCKACGEPFTVPAAAPPELLTTPPAESTESSSPISASAPQLMQQPPTTPRLPMRTRRLLADAEHMSQAFTHSPLIKVLESQGTPPDLYRIEYDIQSLEPTDNPEQPAPRNVHQVEIQLTADYPRMPPQCKMLTPVYHPNIDPSHICVGDHWAAGERLVDLVIRIGEMLAYQAYNIKSPLDAHAAMWADLNGDKLPTDARTIRPAEME